MLSTWEVLTKALLSSSLLIKWKASCLAAWQGPGDSGAYHGPQENRIGLSGSLRGKTWLERMAGKSSESLYRH